MNNITNTFINYENGDGAKLIAMLILGIGSVIIGMIPAGIPPHNRRRFPFLISVLLCFGAGILFATSIVHILPEVRELMPQNSELIFSAGFFIIYFIDETVHYFFGETFQHSHNAHSNTEISHNSNSTRRLSNVQNYGSNIERRPLISDSVTSMGSVVMETSNQEYENNGLDNRIRQFNSREPSSETMTGLIGLLFALSLHSFIEGLAIGVQNTSSKVMLLLGAVSCHKFVMGFCLGLEMSVNTVSTFKSHLISILIFSLGSVIGIGTGIAVFDLPHIGTGTGVSISIPVFQALAGGTLLYVTVSEILPREKSRWHRNPRKRFAGLAQFLAVCVGFTGMSTINIVFSD